MSKDDQRKLNSFHRNQLRKVVGIQWPHKISNEKLYIAVKDHRNKTTFNYYHRKEIEVAWTHSETSK